jgi:predicted nucleotidyltransferase
MRPDEPNADFHDVLRVLVENDVRFIVVGAHALAAHGIPRATQDLDVWIDPTPENAARTWRALVSFGTPLADLGVQEADFVRPDVVVQLGIPPNRIDILTGVTGLRFEEAWTTRAEGTIEGVRVPVLGRQALIQNKRAAGRHKDLGDIEALEKNAARGDIKR